MIILYSLFGIQVYSNLLCCINHFSAGSTHTHYEQYVTVGYGRERDVVGLLLSKVMLLKRTYSSVCNTQSAIIFT